MPQTKNQIQLKKHGRSKLENQGFSPQSFLKQSPPIVKNPNQKQCNNGEKNGVTNQEKRGLPLGSSRKGKGEEEGANTVGFVPKQIMLRRE